jgi:ribonuclease Y
MVVAAFVLGGAIVFFTRLFVASKRLKTAQEQSEQILEEARAKQKEIIVEAKEESLKLRSAIEAEYKESREELKRQERRVAQKEENLERRIDTVERRERNLTSKEKEADTIRLKLEDLKRQGIEHLEKIATLSTEEAKQLLLQEVEKELQEETSRRVHEFEVKLNEESNEKARKVLALAIQRCATEVVPETTVSVVAVSLKNMKGRLIGREGRNIRSLEQATGVDLIIDDTPEAVTISSFDPVRREIAHIALNKLILDGRIHPARIEEVVEKARSEVDNTIRAEGERAAYETGVPALHPEIIKLLGRLKYRTSYGQNVLAHSIEVAHLAGTLAAELEANAQMARKAGLLHDLGKAVTQDVEGPHAQVGAELASQWDKSPEVAQAIAEHHGEAATESILGFIVGTADAISGARTGARRESWEQYLKRLESLESIANSFEGVEKSFAIQAGREVRIMVKPEEIDDLGAMRLSRDIVKKIEESLRYPGHIRVTVIRETRAVDYAK